MDSGWPKQVAVLYIQKVVQFVGDEIVYLYQSVSKGSYFV